MTKLPYPGTELTVTIFESVRPFSWTRFLWEGHWEGMGMFLWLIFLITAIQLQGESQEEKLFTQHYRTGQTHSQSDR